MSTTTVHLASVRESRGITLQQIAQSTQIASHYLRAIEAEEFAKLPSGVYATSYIRQYARAIGYSETVLLDEYRSRAEVQLPVVTCRQGSRVTTRLGAAVGAAMELLHWRPSAKPRAQHPA